MQKTGIDSGILFSIPRRGRLRACSMRVETQTMGVRTPQAEATQDLVAPTGRAPQPWGAALTAGLIIVAVLLLTGRNAPDDESRVVVRVAMSLVLENDLDLDEYVDVSPEYVRIDVGHRRPALPLMASLLLAPFLVLARLLVSLDVAAAELIAEWLSVLLVGASAGWLVMALARRYTETTAFRVTLVFVLGTMTATNGGGLDRHSMAIAFLCGVMFCLANITEDDSRWVARAGLPLSLALLADPRTIGIFIVLAVGVVARWPRRAPSFLLWALPGGVLTAVTVSRALPVKAAPICGVGHAALLFSPQGGLLFFTPIVVIGALGMVHAYRSSERWFSVTLGAAVVVHWTIVGCLRQSLEGFWGFTGLAAVLPLLCVCAPNGLFAVPRLGWGIAFLSLTIQLIGACGGAQRQRERFDDRMSMTSLWAIEASPLTRWAGERIVICNIPWIHDGRLILREYRSAVKGENGSRVFFKGGRLALVGVEKTLSDVHVLGAARIENERLVLRREGDGLFLRVPRTAHVRELELRLIGSGSGALTLAEKTFWTGKPRVVRRNVGGRFRIRQRYHFPVSGGDEILVRLESGRIELRAVMLVGPNEPDETLTLSLRTTQADESRDRSGAHLAMVNSGEKPFLPVGTCLTCTK